MLKQRGDTLIEVIVAMAVLAMAIVGVLSIMNFGFAKNMDTNTRSKVQALLNSQANILRAARDNYANDTDTTHDWTNIVNRAVGSSQVKPDGCQRGARPFVFKPGGGGTWTYPRSVNQAGLSTEAIPQPGNGIWVEAYKYNPSQGVDYYDFYIKACWRGNSGPEQMQSLVRLYAPTD